ncbi:MAG: cytidine deaminase [Candidatus Eisenbacteria bacterium]|nr:cytidine deaminase [Candidatus Latescibacterota bacterium]MBD3302063.1 cytidine deaminase [Candidatus Eisenbacteria bacterium]
MLAVNPENRAGEGDPLDRARRAAARAFVPYSRFRVGAVLEDERGRRYDGCNLECASLGLSVCAERVALGIARTDGARRFRRLWIYTPTRIPTAPCGACRELLARYAPGIDIHLLSDRGRSKKLRLERLLPRASRVRTGRMVR